ncbi:hypothetical protein [Campylobacter concisus]|uniref:Uncharacterized protein n=1 Tax=Campylobacter concisus TaxID=199 RepID=A0A7S9WW74_9BACT|nr:hypothetical protein [Campylobacter concisus]ERJ22597.1 hypothetical protein UNSW1_1482 [Campylobacter concisus UNSW1]QPH95649.1 hypothetical protein CVT08_09700 [Campylobacter concisus]
MQSEKTKNLLDEVNETIDFIFRTCNRNGGTKKALEDKKLSREILKDKFKSIFLKFGQIDEASFKSAILANEEAKELNEIAMALEIDKDVSLLELERAINFDLTSVKEEIYKFQNNIR